MPPDRSYHVTKAKDGTFAVEILHDDKSTPLVISGFGSEAEALAWIDEERNRSEPPPDNPTW